MVCPYLINRNLKNIPQSSASIEAINTTSKKSSEMGTDKADLKPALIDPNQLKKLGRRGFVNSTRYAEIIVHTKTDSPCEVPCFTI